MIFRRILAGAASNLFGKGLTLAVWFLLTPFILDRVGAVGYGLWVLVGSVASYGYLLDMGLGGAVLKYVAEHVAKDDYRAANAVLSTALRLYLRLALIALLGTILLAPAFPALFDLPSEEARTAVLVVALMGVTVALTLAFAPMTLTLQALQRYDLYNLLNAGGSLLTAAATVAVLLAGWGVAGMVAVSIPVTALIRWGAVRMTARVRPELSFRWSAAEGGASLREIFNFSAASFAMQVSGRLNTKTDEFVIAGFRAVSAVAPYALARKLGELAQLLTEQLLKTFIPLAAELEARGAEADLKTLFAAGSRLAIALFVPIALPLLLFGGGVLRVWVGDEYAQYGNLVAILAIAALFSTMQYPITAVLQGVGRHHRVAVAMLAGGLLNVLLSVALLPLLGLPGVALATLIANSATLIVGVLPYACRKMETGWAELVRQAWLPALGPSVPAAGSMLLAARVVNPQTLTGLVSLSLLGGLCYAAVYLSLPVTRAERELLTRRGRNRTLVETPVNVESPQRAVAERSR